MQLYTCELQKYALVIIVFKSIETRIIRVSTFYILRFKVIIKPILTMVNYKIRNRPSTYKLLLVVNS